MLRVQSGTAKPNPLHVPEMYPTWAFSANLAVLALFRINNLLGLNIRRGSESHPLRHLQRYPSEPKWSTLFTTIEAMQDYGQARFTSQAASLREKGG
jgi:hypothetical protein